MSSHPALDGSVVLARLQAVRERLASAAADSHVGAALAPLSGVLGRFRRDDSSPSVRSPAVSNSQVASAVSGALTPLAPAAARSRLAGLWEGGRRSVKGSWLYRWLTAEPEPDVVVIDLRETLTVGPWLRLVQRALEWLLPAAVSSALFRTCRRGHGLALGRPVQIASLLLAGSAAVIVGIAATLATPALVAVGIVFAILALAGSRVDRSWEELRDTRAVGALAAAFEPPEPPESPERTESAPEVESASEPVPAAEGASTAASEPASELESESASGSSDPESAREPDAGR